MPRPIAIDDFMKIRLVSDPQIAPDGKRVVCVVTRIDQEKNKYLSALWMVSMERKASGEQEDGQSSGQAEEPRRFTSEESSARHPRWSPDGTQLAFLSDRQKPKSQIYLLPADGGEARALTNLEMEGGIGAFRWSPDGSNIAFTFRATPEAYRKEVTEERKKKELSSPVRHHTRLFYRLDGMGYMDGEYNQVWMADAQTGECRQLTSGPYDCGLPTWSPDSQTLAFLSDRRDDRDIAPAHDAIYTISPAGGELTEIPSPPGSKDALVWSPDGTQFAYVGNPDLLDTWGTTNDRVFVLPVEGSDTAHDLTGHTDTAIGYLTLSDVHEVGAGDLLQWNNQGNGLLSIASSNGSSRLCSVQINGAMTLGMGSNAEVGGFHVNTSGPDEVTQSEVITMGTPLCPHELYSTGVQNRQLTDFNSGWLREVHLAVPEPLDVDNGSGGKVPGWILKPANFVEGEKYPLVVYVHGGPHAQYGNMLFHELQWLAAEGYVVLYTNPRGSKGYGEAHTKAIAGNWGSVDFDDIMTATDHACGLDYVDADRAAIMGGSYGGYMTAWAIGHTDRFRCAIADRLVANLCSMSGTCDFPWKPDAYYKGNAWSDPAALWHSSPLAYAGNITTPLLLIHSDGDLRCPAGQAEEMFAALRLQRKVVEYLRYPAESSHGLSRNGPPDLRLDRLRHNLDWLNRWLKSEMTNAED
jgi:dipeptidyl aminopeptidase/acylaminoacyl peptidase